MDKTDSQRLAAIEAMVILLKERLLGNGQPGEIEKHNRRLTRLERAFWLLLGIFLASHAPSIVAAILH